MANENLEENPIVFYTSPDGRVTTKAALKKSIADVESISKGLING